MNNEIIQIGDKSYIKARVVCLPTDKASRIKFIPEGEFDNIDGKLVKIQHSKLLLVDKATEFGYKSMNLYFTIDEKIQEGDWCLNNNNFVILVDCVANSICANERSYKKIVATTDETLKIQDTITISQGRFNNTYPTEKALPRPSNSFIQKYVEIQGKIDKVLVEVEDYLTEELAIKGSFTNYRIKTAPDNTITIHPLVEKMYTKEEVEILLRACHKNALDDSILYEDISEFIQNNL